MNRDYRLFSVIAAIIVVAGFSIAFNSPAEQQVQTLDVKHTYDPTLPSGDILQSKGTFYLTLVDDDGNVKTTVESPNLVVDNGLDANADHVFGTALDADESIFNWIAIGTDSTSATTSDTSLGTEVCRNQDSSVEGDSSTGGEVVVTINQTFDGSSCSGSIVEAGVFDASSGGNMFARSTFSSVSVGTDDTLTVTYNITLT